LAGKINLEHVIEMSIKEQLISLFIVPGIPDDFPFKTRTRKEISVCRGSIRSRLEIPTHIMRRELSGSS